MSLGMAVNSGWGAVGIGVERSEDGECVGVGVGRLVATGPVGW